MEQDILDNLDKFLDALIKLNRRVLSHLEPAVIIDVAEKYEKIDKVFKNIKSFYEKNRNEIIGIDFGIEEEMYQQFEFVYKYHMEIIAGVRLLEQNIVSYNQDLLKFHSDVDDLEIVDTIKSLLTYAGVTRENVLRLKIKFRERKKNSLEVSDITGRIYTIKLQKSSLWPTNEDQSGYFSERNEGVVLGAVISAFTHLKTWLENINNIPEGHF